MHVPIAKYSHDEFSQRGQEIYEKAIKPTLCADDVDKFVAIDIESGDFEIDRDDFAATDRLLARRAEAQIWLLRAGRPTAYRIGGRQRLGTSK